MDLLNIVKQRFRIEKKKIRIGIAVISIIPIILLYSFFWADWNTVIVNKTDIKRYNDKDIYLVYTNAGTFKIEDCWYRMQFSSSDLWGKLRVGKNFRIKYYGWRIGILSQYENITKVEPL